MLLINIHIEFRIELDDTEKIDHLYAILDPEVKQSADRFVRSSFTVRKESTALVINITAADFVAAKANVNSLINWTNSAIKILDEYTQK